MFMATGLASGSSSKVWESLNESLGLSDAPVGQKQQTRAGAPGLCGTVEASHGGNHPFKLLLLDQPAPGAVVLSTCPMGEKQGLCLDRFLSLREECSRGSKEQMNLFGKHG